ncbi:MAG TPA: SHOCT domain-containing protein [Caldilineaceae bacterium]|nr:SHOCT domain-containing protein [Caldilineaceae bacterium]
MMDWNWGWGTMMVGGLGMLAFWGLLIALALWTMRAVAGSGGHSQTRNNQPTPLEILQARYARGEINREEYETIRRDLQSG